MADLAAIIGGRGSIGNISDFENDTISFTQGVTFPTTIDPNATANSTEIVITYDPSFNIGVGVGAVMAVCLILAAFRGIMFHKIAHSRFTRLLKRKLSRITLTSTPTLPKTSTHGNFSVPIISSNDLHQINDQQTDLRNPISILNVRNSETQTTDPRVLFASQKKGSAKSDTASDTSDLGLYFNSAYIGRSTGAASRANGDAGRSNADAGRANGEVGRSNTNADQANGDIIRINGEVVRSYGAVAQSNGDIGLANGDIVRSAIIQSNGTAARSIGDIERANDDIGLANGNIPSGGRKVGKVDGIRTLTVCEVGSEERPLETTWSSSRSGRKVTIPAMQVTLINRSMAPLSREVHVPASTYYVGVGESGSRSGAVDGNAHTNNIGANTLSFGRTGRPEESHA